MPVITDPSALGEVALFRGLSLAQLSKLNDLLRYKTFRAGATLITADQLGEVVYLLLNGAVKVHLGDADGGSVIFTFLVAGEVVGEMSLLDAVSRSANVTAVEETTVFWMDRTSFQECLRTMPAIEGNLLRLLCRRLRLANARIQSLATQDLEGRIATQLLSLAELYGQATTAGEILIPFRLTQRDLAALVGAVRERVNRIMAAYKQRQYISVDHHHHITVRNQEVLRRRICGAQPRLDAQEAAWSNTAKLRLCEDEIGWSNSKLVG